MDRILTALIGFWGEPVVVGNTNAQTGPFYAIKAINGPVVFSALAFTKSGQSLSSGDRLVEGDVLFGPVASFTLTSGKVIAYKVGI